MKNLKNFMHKKRNLPPAQFLYKKLKKLILGQKLGQKWTGKILSMKLQGENFGVKFGVKFWVFA